MEKKINIRGAIRMLKPGEFLEVTREQAKPSYLRSACSALTQDYRYSYSVNTLENGKIRGRDEREVGAEDVRLKMADGEEG